MIQEAAEYKEKMGKVVCTRTNELCSNPSLPTVLIYLLIHLLG